MSTVALLLAEIDNLTEEKAVLEDTISYLRSLWVAEEDDSEGPVPPSEMELVELGNPGTWVKFLSILVVANLLQSRVEEINGELNKLRGKKVEDE